MSEGHTMLARYSISNRSITWMNEVKFRLTAMLCGMEVILEDKNLSYEELACGISKLREII